MYAGVTQQLTLTAQQEEYCPPLDSALVHAFYADYAGTSDGLRLAKEALDGIKQAALEEQTTEFDPSGSSGVPVRGPSRLGSDEADSNTEEWHSQTTETDYTGLSSEHTAQSLSGRSASASEESLDGACFGEREQLDAPAKELILADTFPTLRFELVVFTLKKCENNLGKATDELLNHVYFEDAQSSPTEEFVVAKGVDAFSEDHHVPYRGKKGKGKRRQNGSLSHGLHLASASESEASPAPPLNKWQHGDQDVAYITSRTNLSKATVSSLYHRNGASLPATIRALIENDLAAHKHEKEPDAGTIEDAIDLVAAFPAVDLEDAVVLIRLTAPSIPNAHDLTDTLVARPSTATKSKGRIEVIPRYAPIRLSDPTPDILKLPALPSSPLPHTTATLSAARSKAFTQASTAYRMGKSTPLMKAAAGYYSQVGRDINANLKAMSELDADAHVSSQSSSAFLDLHGVSVHDATRIAKERTRAWWDNLGEARVPGGGRTGVGEGYRIITGLGRHSEGGRGKIGPAVVKTLVNEGWKIQGKNSQCDCK
jgi:hypothetical protein